MNHEANDDAPDGVPHDDPPHDDANRPSPEGVSESSPTQQDLAAGSSGASSAGHDADREELEFLERSLDDLDAERSAGDISEPDYRSLSTLYAGREAAVRRRTANPTGGGGRPGRRSRSWRRSVAVLVIVAMVGTGLGVGLASALGSRSSLDTATGDIRQSTRGQLFEAQEHMAAGRFAEAEQIYAEVVATQPSSAEALAWWGWLDFLRGDLPSAAERLETAVVTDPRYPDARVFGAVVAIRLGRLEAAAAHLDVFDGLDPAPIMVELVASYELRERILAGRLAAAEEAGDAGAIEALLAGATGDEMATAARLLADGGQVVLAARLFGTALAADPANVRALVGRGALLTAPEFAAFEDLLTEGLRALDRAVELAPDDPEARFWRALAAARLGLFDEALADLDHLATLDVPPGLLAEAARLGDEVRAAAEGQ